MEEVLERLDQLPCVCTVDDPVICSCGDGDDFANSYFSINRQRRIVNLTNGHIDGSSREGKRREISLSHLKSSDITDER